MKNKKDKCYNCGHIRNIHSPSTLGCWAIKTTTGFCKCNKFIEEPKLIRLIKKANAK